MHCDATPLTTNQQSKKVRNPIQSRPDRQTKKRMDFMWMQNDEDDDGVEDENEEELC